MTTLVKKTFETVEDGIANLIAAATHDYCKGTWPESMIEEFTEGWVVKEGSKYTKISTRNGGNAWGFVVNTDTDKKFKKGDLLK